MARTSKKTIEGETYLNKISSDVESNQSKLSLVLGALIVLVIGILVFNYFNRNQPDLGPSQQTQQEEGDVSPDNLPGQYTIKEGDTLFTVAEKYYNDGFKYTEIAKANNLENVDLLEVGQKIEIPKLEAAEEPEASESPQPTSQESPISEPTSRPAPEQEPSKAVPGSKGAPDITMLQKDWGPKITSTSYTVQEGDWLSTIAARAYNGDIFAYRKLAEVNNIPNPDLIFPGQVLTIPR